MRKLVLIGLALTLATILAYWQVAGHEFVNFDDKDYVYQNSHVQTGLTKENVVWAFTSVHASNWHPITWLTHMADVELYGLNPGGHHLSNLFIHIASTLLLLILLYRLTGSVWKSGFVASMFALHPLHVESVAWVAERKDVLSGFFWFLTLLLYAIYVQKSQLKFYILAIVAFALGLMSKPMLVSLPVVMLIIDFWPLDRYNIKNETGAINCRAKLPLLVLLLKEKIPFFICSVISAAVTIYAQKQGGAVQTVEMLPLGMRLANACTAYVKYIGKMLWPSDLAVYYPFPVDIPSWQVLFSLVVLLALTATSIRFGRTRPYLPAGWFWFLVTLVPVIGIVQVGAQSMADRYTYLPLVGLFIAAAWGGAEWAGKVPHRQGVLAIATFLTIAACVSLTWRQVRYWQNSMVLYRHALQVTSGNYVMHSTLGAALAEKGLLDEAIAEYRRVLEINPYFVDGHYNLGIIYAKNGNLEQAISEYKKALAMSPDNVDALNNLGIAYATQGHLDSSIEQFRKVTSLNPYHGEARYNLAVALAWQGKLDEAILEYNKILSQNPNHADALNSLGLALAEKGRINDAILAYKKAIAARPNFIEAQRNLNSALQLQRDIPQ